MLSDIEIAKQAKMLKIGEVAAKLGISEDEYEPYACRRGQDHYFRWIG